MPTPASDNRIVQRYYAAQRALSQQVAARVRAAADKRAAAAVATRYAPAAVSLAADYYLDLRGDLGVGGRFRQPVVTTRTAEESLAYLSAASADVKPDQIHDFLAQTSAYLVASAGRAQVIASSRADQRSGRFARVTAAGSCSFCLMLATRGGAYRSEDSASFEAHRGCNCTVQPMFTGVRYEPPAHVRQAQSLWSETTDGLHGQDAINAFRRAVERG